MEIIDLIGPNLFLAAVLIAFGAGIIKGIVGFAMPMLIISGLGSIIAPELALAGLIVPTLVTNAMQALRHGARAALDSVRRFRVFLLSGLVMLVISAQFVRVLPAQVMLLIIAVPVAGFSLMQLFGVQFRLAQPSSKVELGVGGFAGLIGGMSGVWGPPTVAYLTALDTEKREHVRVQGVVYGLGALALTGAHLGSGVLRAETLPFSVMLVPPAVLGMWAGRQVQDRIEQKAFRRATLAVLFLASLNLMRRALFF